MSNLTALLGSKVDYIHLRFYRPRDNTLLRFYRPHCTVYILQYLQYVQYKSGLALQVYIHECTQFVHVHYILFRTYRRTFECKGSVPNGFLVKGFLTTDEWRGLVILIEFILTTYAGGGD